MTILCLPEVIQQRKPQIEFVKKYKAEHAPEGVLNLVCAMILDHDVESFSEDEVLIRDGDAKIRFDIFENPQHFVEVLSTGAFVVSGGDDHDGITMGLRENRDLKRETQWFCVHSYFSGVQAEGASLQRALGECALLRAIHDLTWPREQSEVIDDAKEVSKLREKLRNNSSRKTRV